MAQKLDFVRWKLLVDRVCVQLCGLHPDDLEDWRYKSDYDENRSPAASAKRAIANAKKNSGM